MAAILKCLHGDASPKGSTLCWGCPVEDLPWFSVPALGSGLLHSGVTAALILSPLGLCLSGPAIVLFELFLQFCTGA